jgi:hypothetical protein
MKTRTSRTAWLLPLTSLLVLASVSAYIASAEEHEGKKKHGSSSLKLPPAATRTISYTNDVKPIFSDMCFGCHADGQHKGGYRMDTPAQILSIVKKNNSAGSKLIRMTARVGGESDEYMPPKEKLTAEQVGVLRAWVDQGAKFDEKPAK